MDENNNIVSINNKVNVNLSVKTTPIKKLRVVRENNSVIITGDNEQEIPVKYVIPIEDVRKIVADVFSK